MRTGKRVFSALPVARPDIQQAYASTCALPESVGFTIPLQPSRGLRRLLIEVFIKGSGWVPVYCLWTWRTPRIFGGRRRQLISLPRVSHHDVVMQAEARHREELPEIDRHIGVMQIRPRFSVLIDLRRSAAGLPQTLDSLGAQTYPLHEIRLLGSGESLSTGTTELPGGDPADLTGDFVIVLRPGEIIAERTLYEFASEVNRDPQCDVLYADEDVIDAAGRHAQPFYKPGWSPDYLELFCYLGFPVAVRAKLLRQVFAGWDAYDLLLRVTETTNHITHLPQVLGHAQGNSSPAAVGPQPEQDVAALQGRLERTGRSGSVTPNAVSPGCFTIHPQLPFRPSVSVIIPTAGKVVAQEDGRQLDLVVNIVRQLRAQTAYAPLEIIVVDNGDLSAKQRATLDNHQCRRVAYDGGVVNVAQKLNIGAAAASCDLLLLLNDDIEVLEPSWLDRMVAHFQKPHMGILGAKLLYPDGRIQHIGVVLNRGHPEHVRRFFPGDDPGYYHSGCGPRNFLAVTGAVMMVRRDTFVRVGGYSEDLAVNFNDIDFCLKVRAIGLEVACDASIALVHMESKSRPPEIDTSEGELFSLRWAESLTCDPFYNELRLTIMPPTFIPCVNGRLL